MAYEIGTASDYKDLLVRLKEFISDPTRAIHSAGQDIDELDPISAEDVWEIKRWDLDYDGNDEIELIASGPGVTGQDGILVGIRSWPNAAYGGYNWVITGFTAFSDAAEFWQQAGFKGAGHVSNPQVLLSNTQMPYWFIANGRRFAGVARIAGTYYASFYGGYILPFGTPAAIPYPLMIGGSAGYGAAAENVYSATGNYNRGYTDPMVHTTDTDACSCAFLHGNWLRVGNYYGTAIQFGFNVWPYVYNGSGTTEYPNRVFVLGQEAVGGSVALFPLTLVQSSPDDNTFGEMHGIFAAHGLNLVPEDTVTIGGKTYVIFQNGNLNAAHNYFAMLKE